MDVDKFSSTMKIDELALNEELAQQSASYLQVAQGYVKADAEYALVKEEFEVWSAKKDASVRVDFEEQKKKATEKLIESTIKQSEDYKTERMKVIQAKTKMETLKALKESWWMRKDCLIQLCIKSRAEFAQANIQGVETQQQSNDATFYN